jgi:hypothetical protein
MGVALLEEEAVAGGLLRHRAGGPSGNARVYAMGLLRQEIIGPRGP